ncbi:MAG TPA: phospholipase D-like domain-containing protein [Candidatus Babeliales bacterium]|nr:phospholipase D-like domain-containing protein [Candidatus Babeliales bacterium]
MKLSKKYLLLLIAHSFLLAAGTYQNSIELFQTIPQGTEHIFSMYDIRETKNVLIDMFKHAKKEISLGMFYFENKKNKSIDFVLQELIKAAYRGVKIRIVTDTLFYKQNPKTVDSLSNIKNIDVRLLDMKKLTNGVMHAKYMVIDQQELFLGSQNFDWVGFEHVHELGVRIRDSALSQTVKAIFNIDWNLAIPIAQINNEKYKTKKKFKQKNLRNAINKSHPIMIKLQDEIITIYPAFSPASLSFLNTESEENIITSMMDTAKKNMMIQVMEYSILHENNFIIYNSLEDHIKQASLKKLLVQCIFSDWSIKYPSFSYIQALSILPRTFIKVSTIPALANICIPYSRVEHAKYMLIDDDLTWIGTGNWTYSYFYQCRNIGVYIKSKKINQIVKKLFLADWNGPYTTAINPLKKYETPNYSCKKIEKNKKTKVITG